MALINCIDCSKNISDKAHTCPECGCPIQHTLAEIKKAKEKKEKNKLAELDALKQFLYFTIGFMILYYLFIY